MHFNSFEDIKKYCQSRHSKDFLKENEFTNNGIKYIITDEVLIAEAERLRNCIQKHIDDYYDSFTPSHYQTRKLQEALIAQTSVQNNNGKRYIGLYFEPSKSWGQSRVTGKWNGYKPILANFGYKDKSQKDPHFMGYCGYHFIEKGIADWKNGLMYDIDIEFADTDSYVLNKFV